MSGQSKKGMRPTSAAIIVAALLVSASVLFAISPYGLGGAKTVTSTVTTTTATSVMTTTPIQLHRVIFNESTVCDNQYPDRWAVTLGSITISQPSNVTFPFSRGAEYGPAGEAISKITFTVPDGAYNYNVSAATGLLPPSGTVDIRGSDVVVQIQVEPPGFCGGGLG